MSEKQMPSFVAIISPSLIFISFVIKNIRTFIAVLI